LTLASIIQIGKKLQELALSWHICIDLSTIIAPKMGPFHHLCMDPQSWNSYEVE
jgi:hypothetical protein